MKKQVVVALFATVFLLALASVSAATVAETIGDFFSTISDIIQAIADALTPLARTLFGSENLGVTQGTDAFTVANIFIFVIVLIIVFLVVDSINFFDNHRAFAWVLSIAVSVLAVRFLSDGMINAIIFPYKALGIALAAGLPFVIYFAAVEWKMQHRFMRITAWIFLAVIYIFIYYFRIDSAELSAYSWIYLVTAILALCVAALDGTIQAWYTQGKVSEAHSASKRATIRQLQRELGELDADLAARRIPPADYKREVARIRAEIEALA